MKMTIKTSDILIQASSLISLGLIIHMSLGSYAIASTNEHPIKSVTGDLDAYRSFKAIGERISKNSPGDFVTIGADGACDFNSALSNIQDAVSTGVPEIRVASNGDYAENIELINQNITIRGGFSDCTQAVNNNQDFTDLTLIDGSDRLAPVIYVSGVNRHLVRLENLMVINGVSSEGGGGIFTDHANVELQLLRVVVSNNIAHSGGGIGILRGHVDLYGQDVILTKNVSNGGGGGGLFCNGDFVNKITLTGSSLIANNQATRGGGVKLRAVCQMNMYSSKHHERLSDFSGIFANKTTREGGGVHLDTGAKLNLFGQRMCDGEDCLGSNEVPIYLNLNSSAERLANNILAEVYTWTMIPHGRL